MNKKRTRTTTQKSSRKAQSVLLFLVYKQLDLPHRRTTTRSNLLAHATPKHTTKPGDSINSHPGPGVCVCVFDWLWSSWFRSPSVDSISRWTGRVPSSGCVLDLLNNRFVLVEKERGQGPGRIGCRIQKQNKKHNNSNPVLEWCPSLDLLITSPMTLGSRSRGTAPDGYLTRNQSFWAWWRFSTKTTTFQWFTDDRTQREWMERMGMEWSKSHSPTLLSFPGQHREILK